MSENEKTIRQYYDFINEGKADKVIELCDDGIEYEIPGTTIGGIYKGKRQVLDFFRSIQRRYSEELRFQVNNVIENGNHVIVERTTHIKSANGEHAMFRAADIHELRNGRILRMRAYTDTEAIARVSGGL